MAKVQTKHFVDVPVMGRIEFEDRETAKDFALGVEVLREWASKDSRTRDHCAMEISRDFPDLCRKFLKRKEQS
jgi:hypothetical protein